MCQSNRRTPFITDIAKCFGERVQKWCEAIGSDIQTKFNWIETNLCQFIYRGDVRAVDERGIKLIVTSGSDGDRYKVGQLDLNIT